MSTENSENELFDGIEVSEEVTLDDLNASPYFSAPETSFIYQEEAQTEVQTSSGVNAQREFES